MHETSGVLLILLQEVRWLDEFSNAATKKSIEAFTKSVARVAMEKGITRM